MVCYIRRILEGPGVPLVDHELNEEVAKHELLNIAVLNLVLVPYIELKCCVRISLL